MRDTVTAGRLPLVVRIAKISASLGPVSTGVGVCEATIGGVADVLGDGLVSIALLSLQLATPTVPTAARAVAAIPR